MSFQASFHDVVSKCLHGLPRNSYQISGANNYQLLMKTSSSRRRPRKALRFSMVLSISENSIHGRMCFCSKVRIVRGRTGEYFTQKRS